MSANFASDSLAPINLLVIDLCGAPNSLSAKEFVHPICAIAQNSAHRARIASISIVHFKNVSASVLAGATHVILCGNALRDDEFARDENAHHFSFLSSITRPVLGICAGMQALALAHGIGRISSKEIGMKRLTVLAQNPLFSGHALDAYCLHSYSLLPALRDFQALARSEMCVQAIAHKTRPLYGVLFHPEVRNEKVIENFLALR